MEKKVMFGKTALIAAVAEKFGDLGNKEVHKLVTTVFEEIKAHVDAGELVKIPGIGTLSLKTIEAREYRDPRTGTPIHKGVRQRYGLKSGLKDAE